MVAETTTRHGELVSLEPTIDNDICFLRCRYLTGDASGQNMVTIATGAMCEHIAAHSPVRPQAWYVEGNYSGEKKALLPRAPDRTRRQGDGQRLDSRRDRAAQASL